MLVWHYKNWIIRSLTVLGKLSAKNSVHRDLQMRSLRNYSQEIYIQALTDVNFPDYSQYKDPNKYYDDFF